MTTDTLTQPATTTTSATFDIAALTSANTPGSIASTVIDQLRDRLLAALVDGTLPLSDDLLGLPLVGTLFATPAVSLRDVAIDTSSPGAVTISGTGDILDTVSTAVTLTVRAAQDVTVEADLDLTLSPTTVWGPPALALSGVSISLQLRGVGDDRLISGSITAGTGHGSVVLGVEVPLATGSSWVLTTRFQGELLGLLPQLAGDALASLVGEGAPVADLSVIDRVDTSLAFDPHAHRLTGLSIEVDVPRWSITPEVGVNDLAVRLAVEHATEPSLRSLTVAVDATCQVRDLAIPVHLLRDGAGAPWELTLAGGGKDSEGGGLALTDVLTAFGGGDAIAALSPDVAGLPSVTLSAMAVTIDPSAASASQAVSELSCGVHADWEVVPGRLALRGGYVNLDVSHPADPATRAVTARIGGTVEVGAIGFEMSAERLPGEGGDAGWTFHGGLVPGAPLTLAAVLESLVPRASLPPEVPDLSIETLSFTTTPNSGAFVIDGAAAAGFALPFGGNGLAVATVELHIERAAGTEKETGPVTASLRLHGETSLTVADGFELTSVDTSFEFDGAESTWSLAGTVGAELFDQPYELSATLTDGPDGRTFTFTEQAVGDAPRPIDLAGVGSLALGRLTVRVSRSVGIDKPAAGARLDAAATYAWMIEAAGHLDLLDAAIALDGTVTVQGKPGRLGLALRPGADGDGVVLNVPLPGTDDVGIHLALDSLDVVRKSQASGTVWSVRAATGLWFSGLPGDIAGLLPSSRASELHGNLDLTSGVDAAVAFSIDPVLPVQSFTFPSLDIAGTHLDFGAAPAAIEIGRLGVQWARGGGITVEATFGLGVPDRLARLLTGDKQVFVTYDAATGKDLLHFRLSATSVGGTPSLSVAPLDSPFRALQFAPVDQDAPADAPRQAVIGLGEHGSIAIDVPTLAIQGDTFRASGAMTQHVVSLPLSPLRWLLKAMGLEQLNHVLPDKLPVRDLQLYSATTGLNVDLLFDTLMAPLHAIPGLQLPGEAMVRTALQTLADRADHLPDRLKPYLDIHLPEHFGFDLAASATGAVRGHISVSDDQGRTGRKNVAPLRLLFPGLSVTGPVLNGIELWNLSVGEIFGGAALVVTADLNFDQFDLLPIAVMLAAPDEVAAKLPPTEPLTRRLIAEKLTLLIVPELLVAVPVFFDDLGVEYHGIEGAELGAHLSFPAPSLDLAGALKLFTQLKSFFTEPDFMLDEQAISATGLTPSLVAGPLYLRLPKYLGGNVLGDPIATSTVNGGAGLAHLLNGLKGLRFDELFRSLPASMLHAPPAPTSHVALGPISFDGTWDAGTPAGATRGFAAHLMGSAKLGPFASLIANLDVRAAGAGSVGLGFSVDGNAAGFVGVHIDGALDTGALAAGPGGSVLALSDPAARVCMPLPNIAPNAFTVEWWHCPTAVRDYNQTVSADDRWGAFVFHTTASGAVYCGTDASSRFTPADLPAGTVQVNTWQHFAFVFDHGTAWFCRNGLPIASKSGFSLPTAWTGMRLGTSAPGSQVEGGITDLRVWNFNRTSTDIRATMGCRFTGSEPGLIGYWPLDEGSGNVIHDRGPGRLDGSSTGATWAREGGTMPAAPLAASAKSGPAFRLAGNSTLSLFGRQVFDGHAEIQADRAMFDGHLDVFGKGSPLSVTGNLAGAIDASQMLLRGDATVALAGFTLASTTAELTENHLALNGKWLDTFTTNLLIDRSSGRLLITGSVVGGFDLDVTFPRQYVYMPDGPVRVADSFHLPLTFDVALDVRAEEATGLWLDGNVGFTVAGQRRSLHMHITVVPTSFQDFKNKVADAVRGTARDLFNVLFPSAQAWLKGVTNQTIGWTRTAWDDTAKVLKFAYATGGADAARFLDQVSYSGGEIGWVLRSEFASVWNEMGPMLKDSGLGIRKVADAMFAVFEQPYNRDIVTQARSVVNLIRNWYHANDVAQVTRDMFPVDTTLTLQFLAEVHYVSSEIAGAARYVCHLGPQDAARAFAKIGITGDEALRGLTAAYDNVDRRTMAAYLQAVGYARSLLNSVLAAWGIPGL